MLHYKIESNIINDILAHIQKEMITPRNMGLLKSGKRNEFLEIFNSVDINQIIDIASRDEFDSWYDKVLNGYHNHIFPIYRDNLKTDKENPYSYSARLLNKYFKLLFTRSWFYNEMQINLIDFLHPIISNKLIKAFPQLDISRVNQIKTKDNYYEIVDFYRSLIDQDLSKQNKPLLDMKYGIEI